MRHFVLLLCSASACFIGTDGAGGDSTGSTDTGNESGMTSTQGNTTTTSASTTTGSSETTTSTQSTTSTTEASGSESTTGEMTGCESGPLPGPIAGCAPTPLPSTGDVAQDCVDRINQFRWECQCLPPLARWADAETCSDDQSAADQSTQSPHGNFGVCGEYAQNTCPDWGSETDIVNGCLQAMWDEGPGEPFEAHGHYINMSSLDYSRVACGFSASGGGVWSNQNFSQ